MMERHDSYIRGERQMKRWESELARNMTSTTPQPLTIPSLADEGRGVTLVEETHHSVPLLVAALPHPPLDAHPHRSHCKEKVGQKD